MEKGATMFKRISTIATVGLLSLTSVAAFAEPRGYIGGVMANISLSLKTTVITKSLMMKIQWVRYF